jgi:hypothetical protein
MMGHNKLLIVKLGKFKNLCNFLRLPSQVIQIGNTLAMVSSLTFFSAWMMLSQQQQPQEVGAAQLFF